MKSATGSLGAVVLLFAAFALSAGAGAKTLRNRQSSEQPVVLAQTAGVCGQILPYLIVGKWAKRSGKRFVCVCVCVCVCGREKEIEIHSRLVEVRVVHTSGTQKGTYFEESTPLAFSSSEYM